MRRLIAGLAPTLAALAWRNRDKIAGWVADRRNRSTRPSQVTA